MLIGCCLPVQLSLSSVPDTTAMNINHPTAFMNPKLLQLMQQFSWETHHLQTMSFEVTVKRLQNF